MKKKKKKRIYFWTVLTICELLLSVLAADLLDQLLTQLGNHTSTGFIISYPMALSHLLNSHQNRVLFFVLQLLYAGIFYYCMLSISPTIAKVDQMRVTDDISIPVPAGNGQHGAERFLREAEKKEVFATFEWNGNYKKRCPDGCGIVVQMIKEGAKEIIYYIKEGKHSLIIGGTGAGKTRRTLLETLALQILAGFSVVISDVKGEIFYYTYPFAEKLGYKAIAFDLRNPKKSAHYNFLQPILDAFAEHDNAKGIDYTWDLVSVLVGEQKGEPLWYNGETAAIAASILIIVLDAPPEYRNLANVYYFLAFMCESDPMGQMPLNQYLDTLPDTHPAKGVFAMAKIAAARTRSSFFTSALGTLRLFTNPNVAEMTSSSDFKLKDISKEKTILYMMIPDEKKTLYPLVSILLTQLYAEQVGLANENGGRLPVLTDMDLDEVGNFPYIPVLGAIASAGRSRGVRAHLIIQDLQQLESKYKDDYKNIMTNCQTKIYLKSDDPDTLKQYSERLGKYTVEVSSASTSVSDGNKNNTNYSSSASLTGRALLEPSELSRIKAPHSVCMLTGEYPAVNILPDLGEYQFNQMFGLGDEEHNRKLIMEREAAREERIIPELQLWGIWNEFKNTAENEDQFSFI